MPAAQQQFVMLTSRCLFTLTFLAHVYPAAAQRDAQREFTHTPEPACPTCDTLCLAGQYDPLGIQYQMPQPVVTFDKDDTNHLIFIDVEMCYASNSYMIPAIGEMNYRNFGTCAYRNMTDLPEPYPVDMEGPENLHCPSVYDSVQNELIMDSWNAFPSPSAYSAVDNTRTYWSPFEVNNCSSYKVRGTFDVFEIPLCLDYEGFNAINDYVALTRTGAIDRSGVNNTGDNDETKVLAASEDAGVPVSSTTVLRGWVHVGAFYPAFQYDFRFQEMTVIYPYPFKILIKTTPALLGVPINETMTPSQTYTSTPSPSPTENQTVADVTPLVTATAAVTTTVIPAGTATPVVSLTRTLR